MSTIYQLDQENYDLWLSYSWSSNNHGVCGHTFEVIDYYFYLKNKFRVGIFLAEDIDWETFQKTVVEKYEISYEELSEMRKNTVFFNRPKLLRGNNILFTDGGVNSLKEVTLLFKNILHFSCGDFEIKNNEKDNVFVLQDERIYEPCKKNSIHYVKKINFKKYKKILKTPEYDYLIYATKNCRNLTLDTYQDLLEKYSGSFLCLTNKENRPESVLPERIQFKELPVEDLFSLFKTYIYTPVPRKFDCSSRLIAECKFYGKDVIYYNIDYWNEDKGLYWRRHDVENNFASLFLQEGDPIDNILQRIL